MSQIWIKPLQVREAGEYGSAPKPGFSRVDMCRMGLPSLGDLLLALVQREAFFLRTQRNARP